VAIDTVVRYRTFTQLRDALVLPVPATNATVHGDTLWVATERAGQTNVLPLPMPEVSQIHLQPSVVPKAATETLPYPIELPDWSRSWNDRQIDYRNYVYER
ncbi:MAG: hypothetical protein VX002_00255, partial [Bacteroidota bacterium]|nr:hypothetical protein [Bacteroidota bacterium]